MNYETAAGGYRLVSRVGSGRGIAAARSSPPRRPRGRGLSSGAVGFRLLIGRRNKTGHAIDKTLRSLDRLLRALGGYLRAGAGLIVGKFL
jgi:hypothetical protein